ncbi:CmpA/NrtA family ABC transporter substrate-binding protein [Aliiglaciecola sp. LCG003]|uniref:CmpA/NrtA family ABC transporter substrate-binding protein n=1 Tax=Aliiglaciecola sp. LCG003 TaxID=3053655 RepID=UPI002572608C|nr:CmpA/NrtA family ABC transporter substrate-binding protein [Aliiglaciecola sp. LCG003]WJG11114.1 CmpA/NrtA family ABC transporter substrate-binding protein [Aliiglaciecola sp. LCG003]
MILETTDINLGFIPLTDSAPLIVAKEFGFFAEWGLNVNLLKQNSWATLRDKLHAGLLDAAQMLAPMPIASTLGLGVAPTPVITPLILSLNGNAITLSESLHLEILQANKISHITLPMAAYLLQEVVAKRKETGTAKLSFANVFPYSCHYYQLRDWLKSGHISDDDVDIVVVPPVSMVNFMEAGEIDGFCVGGPWNAKAVRSGIGITALTSFDIWQDSPEKVLGLLESYYTQNPNTVLALCAALKQACSWLETIPNCFEAARVLSKSRYLDAPLDVIAPSLLGSCLTHKSTGPRSIPSYNQFSARHNGSINQPELVRGEWLLKQMHNAGQIDISTIQPSFVSKVYRPDIYQQMKKVLDQHALTNIDEALRHFDGARLHRVIS